MPLELANAWQRDFPLTPRPFAVIGEQTHSAESTVLDYFVNLKANGAIDRIGPVFRPNTVGASCLAAMAVPPTRLEEVAAHVSAYSGVNHNYEREHRYNLWFVVTGASEPEVQWNLSCIEHAMHLPVLRLPLLEEYHIDLGFDLQTGKAPRSAAKWRPGNLSPREKQLAARLAAGLPLVAEPYAALGYSQEEVLDSLRRWLEAGVVRRVGAVVRHRRLGYHANAMVVWDVPDDEVTGAGARLAADSAVTLCYRRARVPPDWPFNLFCMVHGRERSRTLQEIERLSEAHDLQRFPRAVLFSRRCFAQRAARYG